MTIGQPYFTIHFGRFFLENMVFKPGLATVARFDAGLSNLLLFTGDFIDWEKPSYKGSRSWMGNLKFNGEPINVRDMVNTLLVRRFPHHYPLVMGDFSEELMEISAWLGLENIQKISYTNYLQNP